MIAIDVRIDLREHTAMLSDLQKTLIPVQLPLSVNVGARALRTAVVERVSRLERVPKSIYRRRLVLSKRASRNDPNATVLALTKPVALYDFPGVKVSRAGGVSVRGVSLPTTRRPFLAKMRSGHIGIFRRQAHAKSRRVRGVPHALPIAELTHSLDAMRRIFETIGTTETADVVAADFELKLRERIRKKGYA